MTTNTIGVQGQQQWCQSMQRIQIILTGLVYNHVSFCILTDISAVVFVSIQAFCISIQAAETVFQQFNDFSHRRLLYGIPAEPSKLARRWHSLYRPNLNSQNSFQTSPETSSGMWIHCTSPVSTSAKRVSTARVHRRWASHSNGLGLASITGDYDAHSYPLALPRRIAARLRGQKWQDQPTSRLAIT